MRKSLLLTTALIIAFLFTSCATSTSNESFDDVMNNIKIEFEKLTAEFENSDEESDDEFDYKDFLNEFFSEKDKTEGNEAVEQSMEKTMVSIEKAMEEISPEMEYYIGRTVAATILSQYKVLNAPELTEYVNKICASLVINSTKPYLYKGYFVIILDTDEINAMATPGGHIFITKGLLKCTDSEDALASVIAHEISHILLGHSIKAIKSSRITDAAMNALITIGAYSLNEIDFIEVNKESLELFNQTSSTIVGTLVNSGFSVAQEYTADCTALMLMDKTGYEPDAMVNMLTALKKSETVKKRESGWGKTHPEPKKRLKVVKRFLRKIEPNGSKKSKRQKRYNSYMQTMEDMLGE